MGRAGMVRTLEISLSDLDLLISVEASQLQGRSVTQTRQIADYVCKAPCGQLQQERFILGFNAAAARLFVHGSPSFALLLLVNKDDGFVGHSSICESQRNTKPPRWLGTVLRTVVLEEEQRVYSITHQACIFSSHPAPHPQQHPHSQAPKHNSSNSKMGKGDPDFLGLGGYNSGAEASTSSGSGNSSDADSDDRR